MPVPASKLARVARVVVHVSGEQIEEAARHLPKALQARRIEQERGQVARETGRCRRATRRLIQQLEDPAHARRTLIDDVECAPHAVRVIGQRQPSFDRIIERHEIAGLIASARHRDPQLAR